MKELFTALAKAQSEFKPLMRNSKNPFYGNKYADMESCRDATIQALSNNGLAVIQPIFTGPTGEYYVKTMLLHSSGQKMEFDEKVAWVSNRTEEKDKYGKPKYVGGTAQDLGIGVTYTRRYAYMAILGLAPEDDDGNIASSKQPENSQEPINMPKSAKAERKAKTEPKPQSKPESPTAAASGASEGKPESAANKKSAKLKLLKELSATAEWNDYSEKDLIEQFDSLGYNWNDQDKTAETINKEDFETIKEYFEIPKSSRGEDE